MTAQAKQYDLMECDLRSFTKSAVKVTKKLASFALDSLTPTHIHFLLSSNFANNFAGLVDQLREIGEESPDELYNLLEAKSADGTPGLYMAMQDGHEEVVRVFGELLKLVKDEDRRAELLEAKDVNGVPGFYLAMQNGRVEIINACDHLMSLPWR